MNAARQFMFETDFSDPNAPAEEETAEAEEPEVEEPEVDLFSEEEIEAARSAGAAQGREQAAAEFHASAEAEVLNLIRDLSENLTQICAIQDRENAKRTGEAVTVASAVCRKIVPDLFEKNSVDEVLHQVRAAVQNLNTAPRVLLTVSPALREAVARRIEGVSAGAGYEGRIEVLEDESLASGDCLMSWGDGGAERRTADVWDQIDAVVLGGAEKVVKSVERAYSRDADIGADSHLNTAETAPPAESAAPPPGPDTGPETAPAPTPEAPVPPQSLEIADKTRTDPAAAPPPPPPEQAPAAAETNPVSDDDELDAILAEAGMKPGDPVPIVEIDSEPETPETPEAAEIAQSPAASPAEAPAKNPGPKAPEAPFAPSASFVEPPAPARSPGPAPSPAPTPSFAPAPKMEAMEVEPDAPAPGGEVDNALDKALGVLSGARKPDAGSGMGARSGAASAAGAADDDEDESVFGEIVDDALDIALGALSQKKKKGR